ncbi:MAG: Crp/Fnr family transcriptional regulator [Alphaproteobacteria bacterium]|nr:Crp/Fnr family transcriptional regulator [Alphaproteobacteria bacterium]
MIESHLLKLRARFPISEEEEAAIRAVVTEERHYRADKTIVRAGEVLGYSTLLLDGLLSRYKDLRDGGRQITELHVAGDFADMHAYTLRHLDHAVMTLSPCRIGIARHEDLRALFAAHPRLHDIYWFFTNVDASIDREWTLSLGRRDARGRVAHLFCELGVRLGLVGMSDETGYDLALTQIDIAECLGLTSVHVNRVLKELRESGIVEFRGGRVEILDRRALEAAAEFDPAYLYLTGPKG